MWKVVVLRQVSDRVIVKYSLGISIVSRNTQILNDSP